jgi:hypothetical protein
MLLNMVALGLSVSYTSAACQQYHASSTLILQQQHFITSALHNVSTSERQHFHERTHSGGAPHSCSDTPNNQTNIQTINQTNNQTII